MQLPKNIRQIGEATDDNRIYIEDYVYTYIRRMKEKDFPVHKFLVLLGQEEVEEGRSCYFISGTLLIEEDWFDHETGEVTEDTWRAIYKNIRIYFNSLEILGWAYIKNDFEELKQARILERLENESTGRKKLVLRISEDGEPDEKIMVAGSGKRYELPGYFIYYEKNDLMQAYLQRGSSLVKEKVEPAEEEANVVTTRFRTRIQEKKESVHQRKIMAYLYMSSTFLVIIVFVIGVTMMNNYDKMRQMEQSLASISRSLENQELRQAEERAAREEEERQQAMAGKDEEDSDTSEAIKEAIEGAEGIETDVVSVSNGILPSSGAASVSDVPSNDIAAVTEPEVQETLAEVKPDYYVIAQGDTLADICRRFYGNMNHLNEICEVNNIEDRDRILYGQRILLP